jgi:hypothetical protein
MVSTAGPGFEPKTSWTLTTRPLTFLKNQSNSDKGKLIVNSVSQPPFGPRFVCFSLIALFVKTFLLLLDHLGFLGFTGITDFWDVSYLNNNSYVYIHWHFYKNKLSSNLISKAVDWNNVQLKLELELITIDSLISKFWNSVNWSITGS